MDTNNSVASDARKKRKWTLMNKRLHSSSSEKENTPPQGLLTPHFDQAVGISNTTPLHGSSSNFKHTQHSKCHCRSTTNSFVRPIGVNLFQQFDATTVETSISTLTPPQTTTQETSDINSSVRNESIPQHYSNLSTNSYVNENDSNMGSNISSNGSSESDTDIDDDYMVDEHLQGFPLLQISIPCYTIICTIDSFISYLYHVYAIIFFPFYG